MPRSANQLDLARAAGVSVSTVSRALSNSRGISAELRAQIQKLAEDLGYRGRSAAQAPARVVRTYVPMTAITGGLATFYHELVDGLTAAARAADISLEVRLIERAVLELGRLQRDDDLPVPDATMFVGVDASADVLACYGPGRPLVLVNTFDPDMRFDCVAPNNYYGARSATWRLLEAGHRSLLHVRDQLRWTTLQRHRGFMAAIDEVPGARGDILDIHGDAETAIGRALDDRRAGRTDWTAMFCVHDMAAVRVIHALEETGLRIPEDVSIVGFDDLPAAAMTTPRLATMKVDCAALGREAVTLAIRRMTDPQAGVLQVECAVSPVGGGTIVQIS